MARHRAQTTNLWALPSLLIPLAVAATAWTSHVASEGNEIAPNVMFADVDVSGLTPDIAADMIADREEQFLQTPVTVDLGRRTVVVSAREIGYDYLVTETLAAMIGARHSSEPWSEFLSWVSAPFAVSTIADLYTVDVDVARARLLQDDFVIEPPVEPAFAGIGQEGLEIAPGEDGVGIDVDAMIALLSEAAIDEGAIAIEAPKVALPPSVSEERAVMLAEEMNSKTEHGMLVVASHRSATITASRLRRLLRSTVADGEMTVSLDATGLQREVERTLSGPLSPFIPPTFEVVAGEVRVISVGKPSPVCCSAESIITAADELLDGGGAFYQLEPRSTDEATALAWADGSLVTELVAEFTTFHACCENRVTNIHRIADMLTGKYLIPGETLSLNEFVGPRTRESGFLPAGAIRGGHMVDEVGGGVSQFVTTLFNAAYFAGLELDEYQSHSVYFSRYPFGREATLSIPGPDLVVTNTTGYPILIWPSYTPTSITVSIYSTRNVEVEELDQRVSYQNRCRHVETDRRRTYQDGRVVVDTIEADYRPGEGIDCSGNLIPQR